MKIGIIIGSIREGRLGEAVAHWVWDAARERGDAEYELIDLKSFGVPLMTAETVPGMANKQYEHEAVTAWSQAIDSCDGFVFITPEYNHGVPGGFKNAVDSLAGEWFGKAVAFVSYGADGGVRAVEQWRQVVGNFNMHAVRQQVSLSLFTEFGESGLALEERREGELSTLLDQLTDATRKVHS